MNFNQIELPQLILTVDENNQSLQVIKHSIQCTKDCRICLQNQVQTIGIKLLQPCKCSGSLQYAHEKCLQKWIEATLSNKNQQQGELAKQFGLKCQICKTPIEFTIITKYTLAEFQIVKERFANKKVYNILLLVIFLIICGGIFFTSWYLNIETSPLSLIFVFSLVGLIFLCLMLCPIIYILIFRILIIKKQKITINNIQNKQDNKKQRRNKVASINHQEDNISYQYINSTLRGEITS